MLSLALVSHINIAKEARRTITKNRNRFRGHKALSKEHHLMPLAEKLTIKYTFCGHSKASYDSIRKLSTNRTLPKPLALLYHAA